HLLYLVQRVAKASRRDEHGQPAVAAQRGPAQRRHRAPTDQDRDRWRRAWQHERLVQTEEIALEVDGLPGREQAQHLDRLIEPPTARGRVDAGVGDLATVLAAGAHAERQPAWSDL